MTAAGARGRGMPAVGRRITPTTAYSPLVLGGIRLTRDSWKMAIVT
jgi:hypothetical protein